MYRGTNAGEPSGPGKSRWRDQMQRVVRSQRLPDSELPPLPADVLKTMPSLATELNESLVRCECIHAEPSPELTRRLDAAILIAHTSIREEKIARRIAKDRQEIEEEDWWGPCKAS